VLLVSLLWIYRSFPFIPHILSLKHWTNKNKLFLTKRTFLPARSFETRVVSNCFQWLLGKSVHNYFVSNSSSHRNAQAFTIYCMISENICVHVYSNFIYTGSPHLSSKYCFLFLNDEEIKWILQTVAEKSL
jgi:hypothetical protein